MCIWETGRERASLRQNASRRFFPLLFLGLQCKQFFFFFFLVYFKVKSAYPLHIYPYNQYIITKYQQTFFPYFPYHQIIFLSLQSSMQALYIYLPHFLEGIIFVSISSHIHIHTYDLLKPPKKKEKKEIKFFFWFRLRGSLFQKQGKKVFLAQVFLFTHEQLSQLIIFVIT